MKPPRCPPRVPLLQEATSLSPDCIFSGCWPCSSLLRRAAGQGQLQSSDHGEVDLGRAQLPAETEKLERSSPDLEEVDGGWGSCFD